SDCIQSACSKHVQVDREITVLKAIREKNRKSSSLKIRELFSGGPERITQSNDVHPSTVYFSPLDLIGVDPLIVQPHQMITVFCLGGICRALRPAIFW
ncbi:MAG: hypothetical protein M3H12_03515, partial [Chromatiales bacterium]